MHGARGLECTESGVGEHRGRGIGIHAEPGTSVHGARELGCMELRDWGTHWTWALGCTELGTQNIWSQGIEVHTAWALGCMELGYILTQGIGVHRVRGPGCTQPGDVGVHRPWGVSGVQRQGVKPSKLGGADTQSGVRRAGGLEHSYLGGLRVHRAGALEPSKLGGWGARSRAVVRQEGRAVSSGENKRQLEFPLRTQAASG